MSQTRGTLVAIGCIEGQEDDTALLSRAITQVKADARRVAVVAAASPDPRQAARPALRAFAEVGLHDAELLALDSAEHADAERAVERLRGADIIHLTAGDAARLVAILDGTRALRAIRERYEAGAVVVGTGAAAAAFGRRTIAQSPTEAPPGRTPTSRGLGLLPDAIVDTRLLQRGHFSRLLEVVTAGSKWMGIGVGERTAFLVRQGRHLEVVGSDSVIIVDGHEVRHGSARFASRGSAPAVEHAIVHALPEGYRFDLATRSFHAPALRVEVSA